MKRTDKDTQNKVRLLTKNPCFVLAHELYDALPIHQFHMNERREWCEKVVKVDDEGNLHFDITDGPTENVQHKL